MNVRDYIMITFGILWETNLTLYKLRYINRMPKGATLPIRAMRLCVQGRKKKKKFWTL